MWQIIDNITNPNIISCKFMSNKITNKRTYHNTDNIIWYKFFIITKLGKKDCNHIELIPASMKDKISNSNKLTDEGGEGGEGDEGDERNGGH